MLPSLCLYCPTVISIHALREEGDHRSVESSDHARGFLSTPSARRATRNAYRSWYFKRNFYPRPPRGGRRPQPWRCLRSLYFYPRPPRGGRRRAVEVMRKAFQFLSTPSARRATHLRGGQPHGPYISIHALREEGDHRSVESSDHARGFLSTPSARRATPGAWQFEKLTIISIHALREEGDSRATTIRCALPYFYPRPPRGGRRVRQAFARRSIGFLSTPSARRATTATGDYLTLKAISIHALREEGDRDGGVKH